VHILYEEAGELKAGTVLAEAPASFQVESPHGRRTKIKATTVLLNFERPGAGELLGEAQKFADGVDAEFLWQCAPPREFGFEELAREYVGRAPVAVEAAGILVKLHASPIYFHRRARGRFQPAPAETVRLALAAVEKKRRTQERIGEWAALLARFECPAEIAALKEELLYAPDRNKPETKALEEACRQTGLSSARLLERCGLLEDSHEYHLRRFLHEFRPLATRLPEQDAPPDLDLPLSEAVAFSLDDVGTTEIDDAFSVRRLPDGTLRVGIHIAAPALAIAPGSALDAIARERLSTAYMPGSKYTMLPEAFIARFSLDEGTDRPAISMYFDLGEDAAPLGRHSRIERVRVGANLRHAQYDVLNEALQAKRATGLPFEDELRTLWSCALGLEARRGKPSASAAALDYSFYVEAGRVRIVPRKRGSPLDKLVSEMMILVNTSWGELLAERDIAAIYRVQSTGKVRFSVHPEPHEGLGVSCYAWMSSPLRRYVDLVNQWQLAAALAGRRPPFARNSDGLLSALRAFEVTYARYDEHQRAMENYWCLRWLQQEGVTHIAGTVLRENLIRLDGLPLVTRVASLPELAPGTRVRLQVRSLDLLERSADFVYRDTLEEGKADPQEAPETGEKA
jgi:exoribonuclease II